jgi:hypothetical protein
MKQDKIWRDFSALPPEFQLQVVKLIATLRARQNAATAGKRPLRTRLTKEPFVGMWRTRKDLRDSGSWVRGLRQREWIP